MLEIREITKTYRSNGMDFPVLKGVSASISDGEFVAIMGPSGSGARVIIRPS